MADVSRSRGTLGACLAEMGNEHPHSLEARIRRYMGSPRPLPCLSQYKPVPVSAEMQGSE